MSKQQSSAAEVIPIETDLITAKELSVPDTVRYVGKVREIMRSVMEPEVDYGHIPGIEKPTLLKPGAEKLGVAFRLRPEYEILPDSSKSDTLIDYSIRCTLIHIPTGMVVSSGLGSCNSRESKYRYRYVISEKKPKDDRERDMWKAQGLGGFRKVWLGKKEEWLWHDKVVHEEPFDFDNTIKKMACKRALIAATLSATAASAIFTQDYDDQEIPADTEDTSPRRQGKPAKDHQCVYGPDGKGGLACKTCGTAAPIPNGNGAQKKPEDSKPGAAEQERSDEPVTYVATEAHMKLEDAVTAYCNGDTEMVADVLQALTEYDDPRSKTKTPGKRAFTEISEPQATEALKLFNERYMGGE